MAPPTQRTPTMCPSCGSFTTGNLAAGLCVPCLALTLDRHAEAKPAAGFAGAAVPAGFEFIETLGRGGMGAVHLVFQANLKRYVALKQIAGRWQENPMARDRFLREAQAAARLSHPGIVPVLEIGAQDGTVWYTMEYVEGGDLAQLLVARGGRLPWPEAIALVEKAARAIEHAHRAGVAHRDLKPSNLLLDPEGNPKIADFGLAWLLAEDGKDLTVTGEILGTPSYLAPECLGGSPTRVDARRSDVYALVALLFHLVAGRPPFVAETPLQVLHAIMNEPAPRLRDLVGAAAVPPWLDGLCARGLAKQPEDRIATAGELAAALSEQRDCGTVPWRLRWPRKWKLVAIVATVAALVAVAAYLGLRAGLTPPSAVAPQPASLLVAVLPLETPGGDPDIALLGAGLQDELAATLLRLSDLRVITAGSVRAANAGHGNFRTAKDVLGAGAVLTGSIRRSQDLLRFTAQLIDTRDGTTRWTKRYDRRETDLFNLQTDIATDVALQLNARLRPSPAKRTLGTSSKNPAAQRLFLHARALSADARQPEVDLRRAEAMFAEAATLDPSFALALAHQSLAETRLYLWGHDRSQPRLERGLEAAQQALRLNPELAEAEVALALYYYRRSRDGETARVHIERAFQLAPHNPEVRAALANLERRGGSFGRAAAHFRAALELDPLNGMLAYNAADTFLRLREYPEAARIITQALARLPRQVALTKLRGDLFVVWRGDLTAMREDLAGRELNQPTPEIYVMHKIDWLVLEGRIDEALAVLRRSPLEVLDAQSIYVNRDGYEALLLQLLGQPDAAKTAAKQAFARLEPELARLPNDARLLLHAGQLKTIMGEVGEGERLIRRTVTAGDMACVDAFDRGFFLTSLAVTLAGAGQDEKAREVLRTALREPNQLSLPYVRLHPALSRYAKDLL